VSLASRLQSKRSDVRAQARKEMRMIEMLREEVGAERMTLALTEGHSNRPLTQALDAPWWIQ
jgi:hypothetical protein